MIENEEKPSLQPNVHSVLRWMRMMERWEQRLRQRLEKLVRPGRSLQLLFHELSDRSHERLSDRRMRLQTQRLRRQSCPPTSEHEAEAGYRP